MEAQDGSFVDSHTSFDAMSEQGMWKESEPEFLHRLEEGLLFEIKEDIQAWLDALKNNRR